MLAIISSRYQYGPFLSFFVAEVMSNYLTTDGLKKMFSTSAGPPEARGICHICHMVNPALDRADPGAVVALLSSVAGIPQVRCLLLD